MSSLTSSTPKGLLKSPPLNIITLEVGVLTYTFEVDTNIESITGAEVSFKEGAHIQCKNLKDSILLLLAAL